jgi:hypothetical protein
MLIRNGIDKAQVEEIIKCVVEIWSRWLQEYNILSNFVVLSLACQRTGNPVPYLVPSAAVTNKGYWDRSKGTMKEDYKHQYKEIWNQMEDKIINREDGEAYFHNFYASTGLVRAKFSSRQHRNPAALSWDAIFPYSRYTNRNGVDVRSVHCVGNIALTTMGLNLASHTALPGILHLISVCWSHMRPGANSIVPAEETQRSVLNRHRTCIWYDWGSQSILTVD